MTENSDKVTDKDVYLNRRRFIQAAVMAGTATATTLIYRRLNPPPAPPLEGDKHEGGAQEPSQEAIKEGFTVKDQLTPLEAITNYNNFYEFDTSKSGVAYAAKGFVTKPWTVSVDGLVNKPTSFDIDELLKFPLEQRIYQIGRA